ncbi:hypothetical protein E1B28_002047 [Marasmius oreades]|uniref:Uncharacterized protein n=1 Tax=Marasmius oreades TaxID=181124 RepID=A0A9P8AG53_9AGAR|nr:uncharacterized protein E1B28_002047 [Marasmius oreades]KAG7100274.1 hypothetical protein E1B28_002047 [Marasmius oreades]
MSTSSRRRSRLASSLRLRLVFIERRGHLKSFDFQMFNVAQAIVVALASAYDPRLPPIEMIERCDVPVEHVVILLIPHSTQNRTESYILHLSMIRKEEFMSNRTSGSWTSTNQTFSVATDCLQLAASAAPRAILSEFTIVLVSVEVGFWEISGNGHNGKRWRKSTGSDNSQEVLTYLKTHNCGKGWAKLMVTEYNGHNQSEYLYSSTTATDSPGVES